ncbi:MAG: D-glycero-beta-D-manno-heptose 1-phosphate adenylyltransferase [Mariprofundales bacterium]
MISNTRNNAYIQLEKWRKSDGMDIVFTNGCFDLLHPGHVKYLQDAALLGHLVVGVNDDASIRRLKGNNRPINKLSDRMCMLSALQCVDLVVPFDEDTPLELIKLLHPDVLIKGGDYQLANIVGRAEVQSYGGRVFVIQCLAGYSSSKIIERILNIK